MTNSSREGKRKATLALLPYLALAFIAFALPAAAQDGDVVLELTFNDVIIDNSTNPINFTTYGALTFNTDTKFGTKSWNLDDVANYLALTGYTLNSKINLNSSTAAGTTLKNMTILTWVKMTDASTEYEHVYGFQGHGGGCSEGNCGLDFAPWANSNRPVEGRMATTPTDAGFVGCQNTGSQNAQQAWGAWAFTYDGVNMKTYLNSTESCSVASSANYFPNNANFFPKIGFTGSNQNEYSDFNIAHLCVINATLNNSQLNEYYNSGNGQKPCGEITGIGTAAAPPAPTGTEDLTITATDLYDATSVDNFTITAYNTTHSFTNSTTSGTVKFGILTNTTAYTINFSSNFSGGYFNESKEYVVALPQTLALKPYQAYVVFNATQLFSNTPLSALNVSTPSQANQSTTNLAVLRMKAGTYVANGSTPNHYNTTVTFTISARSNSTINFTFYDSIINVSLHDAVTNATILTGFTLNVTPINGTKANQTFNILAGNASANFIKALKGYTFNFNITQAGNFSDKNQVYSVTLGSQNFTMFLQSIHSLYFQIFNEQTRKLIDNHNTTIRFRAPTTSFNASTGNGTLFVGNLTPGDYEITYSADTFVTRFYYLDIPVGGNNNINLYLLDNTNATELKLTVKDQDFDEIENATIHVLRYFTESNGYEIVEMARTAFDGVTSVNVKLNTEFYRFKIVISGDTKLFTAGTKLTTSHGTNGLNFQINTETNTLKQIENLRGVEGLVTFSPSTSAFTFTYTDDTNTVTSGCLQIVKLSGGSYITVNESCTSSTSASIVLKFDNSTDASYLGRGMLKVGGDSVIADEESAYTDVSRAASIMGNLGLLIVAIVIMGLVLTMGFDPRMTMIATAFAFMIPMFMGITVFTMLAAMGILSAALILGTLISTTRTD